MGAVRQHGKRRSILRDSFSLENPRRSKNNPRMPNWLLKSAVQRAISFLPQSHRWNELLQNKITQSLALTPGRFEVRLRDTHRYLEQFLKFGAPNAGEFSVLELGTGWNPVMPVGLYLCGASEVWTIDIVSHLTPARIRNTLGFFVDYHRRGALEKLIPRARPDRLAKLQEILAQPADETVDSLLPRLNIHVVVRDAQDTGIPPASVDLFCSNSVLEYIPPAALANMLAEFKRVARPGAVLCHFINLGDEYAKFDSTITPFNFLKYSDAQWRLLDSPFTRKNRLRISDYRELLLQAGGTILQEDLVNGDPRDLERIRLAPRFQHYSPADLLVLQAWITAKF
jgi:SAM-dependent methyltransferase